MKLKSLRKNVYLFVVAVALAQTSNASEYYSELNAGYVDGELFNIDFDSTVARLTAYYNFINGGGVSLDNGAYAESGFLSRASSISVRHTEVELDGSPETDSTSVDARLVFGDQAILELSGSEDPETYSFGFGAYWGNSSSVVRLSKLDTDPVGNVDPDPFTVQIDTHSYLSFNDTNALAVDVTIGWVTSDTLTSDGDSERDFSFVIGGGATYYIGRNLGLGVVANWNEIGGIDTFTYGANAAYFVTPRFGLAVSYLEQDQGKGVGTITEALSVTLTGRL